MRPHRGLFSYSISSALSRELASVQMLETPHAVSVTDEILATRQPLTSPNSRLQKTQSKSTDQSHRCNTPEKNCGDHTCRHLNVDVLHSCETPLPNSIACFGWHPQQPAPSAAHASPRFHCKSLAICLCGVDRVYICLQQTQNRVCFPHTKPTL